MNPIALHVKVDCPRARIQTEVSSNTMREVNARAQRTFHSADECRMALRNALQNALQNDGAALNEQQLSLLVDACECEDSPPSGAFGLRIRRWIIRDSDLNLFDTIKTAVLAMASANYAFGNVTAAMATSVALAILGLSLRAYRRGVTLTVPQGQVLTVLSAFSRPIDAEAVFVHLAAIDANYWQRQETVETELRTLGALPTRKGLMKSVEQTSDGRWMLADI